MMTMVEGTSIDLGDPVALDTVVNTVANAATADHIDLETPEERCARRVFFQCVCVMMMVGSLRSIYFYQVSIMFARDVVYTLVYARTGASCVLYILCLRSSARPPNNCAVCERRKRECA